MSEMHTDHGETTLTQRLSEAIGLIDREPQTAWNLIEATLRRAEELGDVVVIAQAKHAAGVCLTTLGHLTSARRLLVEARSMFVALHQTIAAACCQRDEAVALYFSGDYSAARALFQVAQEELERHGQALEAGRCRTWMAILENFCHNSDVAEAHLAAAQTLLQSLDVPTEHAICTFITGMLLARRARYADTLDLFDAAAAVFKQHDQAVLLGRVYCEQSYALLSLERFDAARDLAEQAGTLFQQHGLSHRVGMVNDLLGVIATSINQFEVAYPLLEEAQRGYAAAEMRGYQAQALLHRANLDYYLEAWSAAEASYRSVAESCRTLGAHHLVLVAESNLGFILGKQGRYDEALVHLEAALDQALALGRVDDAARCHRQIAQLYTLTRKLSEAEVHYRQMLDLYRELGTPVSLARAQTDYADFYGQQGRYPEAETLLELAYALFKQEKVPLYIADCELQQARVALAQQKVALAEQLIASSAAFYEEQQRPLAIARVRHVQGDLARMTQQGQIAASLYEQAFAVLAELSPAEGVQLAAARADIAQQADDVETALLWQRRAIRALQQARSRVPTEALASQLVHQHLPLVCQALTLALRLDQPAVALGLAEDARAQVALAWIEGQRRDQPPDATTLQLAGRIRGLRHELNRMQEQLEAVTSEDNSAHLLREFKMRQDTYDQELALWRRFGSNVIPGMPQTFDWAACQSQLCALSPDWQALVYWLDDSWLITWHCTPSSIQCSQRQLSRKELSALRLCCNTEPEKREFVYGDDPDMMASRTSHLQRVAALLIPAQAVATLTPETLLIIVPADMMHALPFAALPLNEHPLVTYATPLIVPSLQLLSRLLERPATNAKRLLAIGVQQHLDRPRLAHACDEAAMVAKHDIADVWCNEDATMERLQEASVTGNLRQYRMLHLATHAWSHNLYAAQAGFALANGDMLVTDVAHLNLDAELVVLSACESGVGKRYPGEEIVGLSYALLQAGARAMLVSLWQVSDRASLEMMTRFYEVRRTGMYGPWSLAAAQRDAWRAGVPAAQWAAYQWIGTPAG